MPNSELGVRNESEFAVLYLDTLELAYFSDRALARSTAFAVGRPFLRMTRRDRKGREVWTVQETCYQDPQFRVPSSAFRTS